jgi:hypothetical protein
MNQESRLPMAEDELAIILTGGVPLEPSTTNASVMVPAQLLGGGDHNDGDRGRNFRRQLERRVSTRYDDTTLPRENLLIHVTDSGLRRFQLMINN